MAKVQASAGDERVKARIERVTQLIRQVAREAERVGDAARKATDSFTRYDRREWEHPDRLLEDEDHAELEARSLRRTLEDIDDLPERDEK
jgi:hypothetical protein